MPRPSLDHLYSAWNTEKSNDALNDLILAVRDRAVRYFRSFGADAEDMAQDVAILVLGKLPDFTPQSEVAFTHWIAAIFNRIKLDAYKAVRSISADELPEQAVEDHDHIDLTELPAEIEEVAEALLLGLTLKEIAESQGMSLGTLTKKLHRFRNRAPRSPSAEPLTIERGL